MRKYMVLCLTAALLISGCLNQTNESEYYGYFYTTCPD